MINLEILRLEINELLYHIEAFLGTVEKIKAKDVLNKILIGYVFAENAVVIRNDINIIKSFIQELLFVMENNEYTILVNNISTLIKFINIQT